MGLQGSYRRGEATEASDIDVVCILDKLALDDLARYRALLVGMPQSEKACGFICGRRELAAWPRHELFQFCQETQPYIGDLRALLPPMTREDIRSSVRIGAANLYHELCHCYLYGARDAERLRSAYKAAFFLLQVILVLRGNEYPRTQRELARGLAGDDFAVLDVYRNWQTLSSDRAARPDFYYELLLNWCSGVLCAQEGEQAEQTC